MTNISTYSKIYTYFLISYFLILSIFVVFILISGCIGHDSINDSINNDTVQSISIEDKQISNDSKQIIDNKQISSNKGAPYLGVFYYPWTGGNPEKSLDHTWLHWKDDKHDPPNTWASNYIPDYNGGKFDPYNGLYSSKDTNIIKQQLGLMKKAEIDFAISSWWGKNSYEDQTLDIIFNQVLPGEDNPYREVKFCIYYEKDGFADVPKSDIISDINYIKKKYTNSSYYFKIDGKPVVFVYNTKSGLFNETSQEEVQKWKEVRDEEGIYLVLKVFGGYQKVADLADSWHEYAPATNMGFKQVGNYSAFVTPGFHKWHESPRLVREDFIRFDNNVKSLANANVSLKLIETWNEWGEGTGIEPAIRINHDDINGFIPVEDSYGTQYIDIIGKYFVEK